MLDGPPTGLLGLAFRPDGRWLAGAGADGGVWVWDRAALALGPAQLRRHRTEVNAVEFDASGGRLASAGADALVNVWSIADGMGEPNSLAAAKFSVNGLAFAPDGQWLITGGTDAVLRRWTLAVETLIATACRTAGRNLTLAEWDEYFPTESYRPTCPDFAPVAGGTGRRAHGALTTVAFVVAPPAQAAPRETMQAR